MSKSEHRSNELPSAFSLFGPSIEALMVNLITLIELVAVPLLLVALGGVVKKTTGHVISGVGELLTLLLSPAAYLTQIRSVQKKTIDFTVAIKESFHYFWRLVGLWICLVLIIGIGLCLFIVPGLFMLRRYILSPFYLIDRDMKVFDAMKASAADSKTFSASIWGIIGVEALLALASGIISVLLGPLSAAGFLVYYLYYCAEPVRYFQIKAATHSKSSSATSV